MKQIVLKLSYVGTRFCGFQVQDNGRTVQGELEAALQTILGGPHRVAGCGRTDAGVHAKVYYASFVTERDFPLQRLPLALNANLCEDIGVEWAREVPLDFHPRFDACSKTYTYQVWLSHARNPFLQETAYHYPRPLDVERFCTLATHFEGTHDFVAFMTRGSPIKKTVRTIYSSKAWETDGLLQFQVQGNGFLYNMVRIMVGTLLESARREDFPSISEILNGKNRSLAGPTAPPEGLHLTHVDYGGKMDMPI